MAVSTAAATAGTGGSGGGIGAFGGGKFMKKIMDKRKAKLDAANAVPVEASGGGDLESRVSALESAGDAGGAVANKKKMFGGMQGGIFDFMRKNRPTMGGGVASGGPITAGASAVGMPYKMAASGKHGNSPIDKNFGSKEHRGFGHNKPIANPKTGETPLDMKSFGVGSLTGGVAAKGRSKTGGGGKFNN